MFNVFITKNMRNLHKWRFMILGNSSSFGHQASHMFVHFCLTVTINICVLRANFLSHFPASQCLGMSCPWLQIIHDILGDRPGLGKTITTMTSWSLNHFARWEPVSHPLGRNCISCIHFWSLIVILFAIMSPMAMREALTLPRRSSSLHYTTLGQYSACLNRRKGTIDLQQSWIPGFPPCQPWPCKWFTWTTSIKIICFVYRGAASCWTVESDL